MNILRRNAGQMALYAHAVKEHMAGCSRMGNMNAVIATSKSIIKQGSTILPD